MIAFRTFVVVAVAVLLTAEGQNTVRTPGSHTDEGHFIPPELRRERPLQALAQHKKKLTEKLANARGHEKSRLERELGKAIHSEEEHREGIVRDTKHHHDLRKRRVDIMQKMHPRGVM